MTRRRRLLAGVLALWACRASEVGAVALARGPYLQNLGQSRVTIAWRTDSSAACSVANRPYPAGTTTTWACGSGTTCTCTVLGLSAGTQYAYVPQANGAALAGEVVYATDPGPGDGNTIVASTESMYHFTRITIDGDVLTFQAIRDDGAVRDQGTFQHRTP